MAETAPAKTGIGRKSLIFAENVLNWTHYKPDSAMRIFGSPGVP